jgi:hypothetical protein
MLASVAAIAALLFVGTMIRTQTDTDPTRGVGGLRILAEGDVLLAFEDFSFDAEGWSPAGITNRLHGMGPVLGPFGAETVQRRFDMPAGTDTVHLSMDLHMIGDWSDAVRIAINDTEMLLLTRPDPDQDLSAIQVHEVGAHRVAVRISEATSPAGDAALPGSEVSHTTFNLLMYLRVPARTFTLRIDAVAAPAPDSGAVWALDNVTAIAIPIRETIAD